MKKIFIPAMIAGVVFGISGSGVHASCLPITNRSVVDGQQEQAVAFVDIDNPALDEFAPWNVILWDDETREHLVGNVIAVACDGTLSIVVFKRGRKKLELKEFYPNIDRSEIITMVSKFRIGDKVTSCDADGNEYNGQITVLYYMSCQITIQLDNSQETRDIRMRHIL